MSTYDETISATGNNFVTQQAFGLFDAALQIADRIHLAESTPIVTMVWAISETDRSRSR